LVDIGLMTFEYIKSASAAFDVDPNIIRLINVLMLTDDSDGSGSSDTMPEEEFMRT
jgi:hypothetical protein